MKRKRRILLSSIAGALLVCAVLAYYLIFPRLVSIALKHTLAGAGVRHVTLDVSNASLWHAHLANIVVGETETPIEIRNIGLHYTPRELLGGNLNAIVLSGVTISLAVKDGKVDLGPITPILENRAHGAAPATKKVPTTSPTLPVDRVVLRDSTLVINTPRGQLKWPMNAALLVNRNRKYALNMTLHTLDEFTISGTLDPNGEVIDLTAAGNAIRASMLGQILEGLVQRELPLQGTMDAESHFHWENGSGTLSATVKPNDLAFANLSLASGVLQVDTTLGGPAPAAKLAISDVQVQAAEIKVEGINGNLTFPSLSPLASAAAQEIKVAKVSMGQLEMTDGSVQFEMKSPQSIRINATRWNVLGGSVSAAAPFEIKPGSPNLQFTLRGDEIDLKALLDLFGQGKVSGSGLLTGEIPIVIGPSGVKFGQGTLVATRDGQIRVKDLSTLAAALGQSGGVSKNQSSAQQVRQNIMEALSDFQYDDLKADLQNDENGKPMAVIHLAGKGTSGAKQAIELDLRIRGIDDIIRVVLNIRSRMNDAQSKGG